jgi:hypothetical protein
LPKEPRAGHPTGWSPSAVRSPRPPGLLKWSQMKDQTALMAAIALSLCNCWGDGTCPRGQILYGHPTDIPGVLCCNPPGAVCVAGTSECCGQPCNDSGVCGCMFAGKLGCRSNSDCCTGLCELDAGAISPGVTSVCVCSGVRGACLFTGDCCAGSCSRPDGGASVCTGG